MDQSDPIHNYVAIRDELRLYDESLLKRPEIIVVTKSELPGSAEIAEKLRAETNRPVYNISAVTGKGLPDLVRLLGLELEALREADRIAAVAAAAAAARAPVEPLAAADPA
jgi:GTP-binding protein